VSATDRFNMATVAKGATVVQPGLFDDVAHVVHESGPTIPTGLNIASRAPI
jgi:hypothetical protein